MRVGTTEGTWIVPPGRALWVPARREHWIRCVDAVSMRTVYLAVASSAWGDEQTPGSCEVWNVSPLMREVMVRICDGAEETLLAHLLAVLRAEIRRVHALPLHLPDPEDSRLRRITDTIRAAPDDERSLAEWAQQLGLSPRTLIRRFQAATGLTFRQWRRQARLLAALEQLGAGLSVTRVALDVGYVSVSAFVEAFREAFGTTPARYFADH